MYDEDNLDEDGGSVFEEDEEESQNSEKFLVKPKKAAVKNSGESKNGRGGKRKRQ